MVIHIPSKTKITCSIHLSMNGDAEHIHFKISVNNNDFNDVHFQFIYRSYIDSRRRFLLLHLLVAIS